MDSRPFTRPPAPGARPAAPTAATRTPTTLATTTDYLVAPAMHSSAPLVLSSANTANTVDSLTVDPPTDPNLKLQHRLSLIANDELALGHIIFDLDSDAQVQPPPSTTANNSVSYRHQGQQQQPIFALPVPPPPPAFTLSTMANQHLPAMEMNPPARSHGPALQQQRPTQPTTTASGLAFPSLSHFMPASSDATSSNPTTLELAILANSAASQHFGMPPPPPLSSTTSKPFAQQRTRSRSLAQATTVSAPFTTCSDPVPGPTAGSATILPASATARGPANGLITTPGMPAYPTRIAHPPADDPGAIGSRARSMSTPQLTSQDDLLGNSTALVDQSLAAQELQRLRAQQLQRAFSNSRSSPDPSRNRVSVASSSISTTNRLSSSSTHNLVGGQIDRPVSASSMAAIPPQSPGFPASEHDDENNVVNNPNHFTHLPASQSQGNSAAAAEATTSRTLFPGWPLTATGEPSDYLPRVPIVSTYTFHDYPSISHYTSGAIPFSRSSAITSPPVIVPINPQTLRLSRNWAKTGDRPVSFHTLSETLSEMDDALDTVRRTGVRADPAVLSAHRLNVAGLVRARVASGAGAGTAAGVDKVDALVEEVNAWMCKWDRIGVHAVVDWVLGVMTGWTHHLCMPLPGQADMDAFDDWLDHVNEHWMHPKFLHLRNPFDNGLMFLELELLEMPAASTGANAPPPRPFGVPGPPL